MRGHEAINSKMDKDELSLLNQCIDNICPNCKAEVYRIAISKYQCFQCCQVFDFQMDEKDKMEKEKQNAMLLDCAYRLSRYSIAMAKYSVSNKTDEELITKLIYAIDDMVEAWDSVKKGR